jgi:hypothetical protein
MAGMEGLTAGRGFGGVAGAGNRPDAARPPGREQAVRVDDPPDGENGENRGISGSAAILRRELIILAIALVFGFLLVPLAIWAVGNRILGPYTHLQDPTAGTGPARLLADFYDGLVHGSLIFWCVGLGPYVLVWLIRLIYSLIRPAPVSA